MFRLVTVTENLRQLVMARNCLETTERDFKVRLSPSRNLTIDSHISSGIYEHAAAAIFLSYVFLLLLPRSVLLELQTCLLLVQSLSVNNFPNLYNNILPFPKKIKTNFLPYLLKGSFYEEVGQLTSSVQSFNSANQILSDDMSHIEQILIWTTCSICSTMDKFIS